MIPYNPQRAARGIAAALATLGLAAAIQLATAGSAAASVNDVVTGHSATDSAASKSATAFCPAGTRVFGGGGDIVGGGHGVSLSGLVPVTTSGGDSFVATAEEDAAGYAPTWTVYAYAICGTNLKNVTIAHTTATYTSGDRLNAATTCPAGTDPVGLGAKITNGTGHVVLNSLFANNTSPGAQPGWANAQAFIGENGSPGGWSLTSYAVCAVPPPGLIYRFADAAVVDSNDKSATIECPAGTRTYGVGGSAQSNNNGQTHFDRVVPHGGAWTGADVEAREDLTGYPNNWFAQIEAVCAV